MTEEQKASIITLGTSVKQLREQRAANTLGRFGGFTQLPDNIPARGRAYMAPSPVIGTDSKDTVLEMLVETGHCLVSELAPGLQNRMNDYHEFQETHKIVTARLEGIGMGTINDSVTNQDGNEHDVELSGTVVPGLDSTCCTCLCRQVWAPSLSLIRPSYGCR